MSGKRPPSRVKDEDGELRATAGDLSVVAATVGPATPLMDVFAEK
jgi:hypothetical protein